MSLNEDGVYVLRTVDEIKQEFLDIMALRDLDIKDLRAVLMGSIEFYSKHSDKPKMFPHEVMLKEINNSLKAYDLIINEWRVAMNERYNQRGDA